MEVLEGKTRSGLEDARTAIKGEVQALREEQAKALRQVERRLVRLEAGKDAQSRPERASSAHGDRANPGRSEGTCPGGCTVSW